MLQVYFTIFGFKVLYKVILSVLMDIIKYSQCTKCNKFDIYQQCLKNEVSYNAF